MDYWYKCVHLCSYFRWVHFSVLPVNCEVAKYHLHISISFFYFSKIELFQTMAYCSMNKTGSSGIGEMHDTFCVLSMNTHFNRAFLFTWLWLVLHIIITSFTVVTNRVSTFISQKFRYFSFRFYYVSTTIWFLISHTCILWFWAKRKSDRSEDAS